MSCIKLHSGQDSACKTWAKKYYQQIILVNKDDVLNFNILLQKVGLAEDVFGPGFSGYVHRIRFQLKPEKTGFLFRGSENGVSFFATFSKQNSENIPQYKHDLQLPVFGATEETKGILKELDNADYFAAIQLTDGTIEVYGFENGLTSSDYTYDVQGNLGGSFIPLQSKDLEDEPPYIYNSETPEQDFNNLFQDVQLVDLGSFNNDFNNDFDINLP